MGARSAIRPPAMIRRIRTASSRPCFHPKPDSPPIPSGSANAARSAANTPTDRPYLPSRHGGGKAIRNLPPSADRSAGFTQGGDSVDAAAAVVDGARAVGDAKAPLCAVDPELIRRLRRELHGTPRLDERLLELAAPPKRQARRPTPRAPPDRAVRWSPRGRLGSFPSPPGSAATASAPDALIRTATAASSSLLRAGRGDFPHHLPTPARTAVIAWWQSARA
jgi:hypothetical protein